MFFVQRTLVQFAFTSLQAGDDDTDRVVQAMRHAGGECAQRGQALGMACRTPNWQLFRDGSGSPKGAVSVVGGVSNKLPVGARCQAYSGYG